MGGAVQPAAARPQSGQDPRRAPRARGTSGDCGRSEGLVQERPDHDSPLRSEEPLKLHGLHHTWATLALAEGIDIHIVSERLNHSSTHVTREIYTHVTPPMQSDAAERVAGRVFGGGARPQSSPDRPMPLVHSMLPSRAMGACHRSLIEATVLGTSQVVPAPAQ